MKKIVSTICIVCFVAALVGCATSINTKDVTKIVVTTTGLKVGQSQVDKTPELMMGRQQVEYIKVPTGLNGANATAADVAKTPVVVSSYEANAHSAVFGNAAITSTVATDQGGATLLGGQHQPINAGTGLNNPILGSSITTQPAATTSTK